jgi:hypothetical protein
MLIVLDRILRIIRAGRRATLVALLLAAPGAATPTDPTLALADVAAHAEGGPRLLRLDGSFQALDLVQLAWPLQILVRETTIGTGYVRFDVVTGPVTGTAPSLANGLDAADVPGLLASGSPSPDGALVFLGVTRLEVLLPATFPAGPAEVQLFVVDEGEVVLSNPLAVTIGDAP